MRTASTKRRKPQPDHTAQLEELAWLLKCGETHPETLAARLGVSTKTINRYLRELRQRGHPGAAA